MRLSGQERGEGGVPAAFGCRSRSPRRRRAGRRLTDRALRGSPQSSPLERDEVPKRIAEDASGFYDKRFEAGYQRDFESGYDACALAAVEWALKHHGPAIAPGCSVLDYGCGQGRWLAELARLLPGATLSGADISPVGVALAERRFPDAELMRADGGIVPAADSSFDVVVMLDVLEHVEDAAAACAEVARLLRGGGVVVLTTPCASACSVPWLVNWLIDGFEPTADGFGRFATDEPAHLRRLSRKQACRLLGDAGLRMTAVRFWAHAFFHLARYLPQLPESARTRLSLLDWQLLRRVPKAGAMVIVAKREAAG